VAAGLAAFGLGSDTGGSVRQPASFCGIYGLKPTWGAVSRFGLVAYASSLEGIGVMSKTVDLAETVFSRIRGQDPMDQIRRLTGDPERVIPRRDRRPFGDRPDGGIRDHGIGIGQGRTDKPEGPVLA
jgi:Asp-tRNA(Asn)/Glu-tRNA(Gln) amidotransferase A subunit family amidase